MIDWYIDSLRTDEKYLKKVKETVTPCMNYFCEKLSEIEVYDIDLFRKIIEELPILNLQMNNDEFYFSYNSYTNIKFKDSMKSIKREIILNNIFGIKFDKIIYKEISKN